MLELLIWATVVVCLLSAALAYHRTRDVFHPALILSGLCLFIYGYMPLSLVRSNELFLFVTEQQAEFGQFLALAGTVVLLTSSLAGGASPAARIELAAGSRYSHTILRNGAFVMGAVGLGCWLITIRGAGGFTAAFGQAYGSGWSEYGYIRDGVYLLIVALVLLLTPECYRHRTKGWFTAVPCFSIPFVIQGLLGARRGPTFVIVLTLVMSWYLARQKRPHPAVMAAGGLALGATMLFLVTNRGQIHLGSDFEFQGDITAVATTANESNEYIFGTGAIVTANQTGQYFWGRRYLAEIVVRPIPKQIWPTKYEDFGVPELTQNAGVAGGGLQAVMGWSEIPGAAAAMIADLWVEFSWLYLPILGLIGYGYGVTWRNAVWRGGPWNSQYVILCILSVYLVTQSGEAVIFRLLILSAPIWYVWRRATQSEGSHHPFSACKRSG
jgi:hypothetical protein